MHKKNLSLKRVQPFCPLENLLRVIVTVVLVVDVLLQVVVGVGLLRVLAEGSVSRVSTSWWLHNQKVSDTLVINQER